MNWLKKLINKLLKKNNIKLLEPPKEQKKIENLREDFRMKLIQNTDLERNDGNGYKISPNIKLRDMI